MSYRLLISRTAAAQIRVAADWWSEHRTKAPAAFQEDVERGLELIRLLPSAGEPVEHSRVPNVRRILLGRIRYHIYYTVSVEAESVEVLALWHTSRGRGPDL